MVMVMDSSTLGNIAACALTLHKYAALPEKLRQMAELAESAHQKSQLLEIAQFLEMEVPKELFKTSERSDRGAPKYIAYLVCKLLLSEEFQDHTEIAQKLNRSPASINQIISALRQGGVKLQEATSKGYRILP